jgi:hypothetical protein
MAFKKKIILPGMLYFSSISGRISLFIGFIYLFIRGRPPSVNLGRLVLYNSFTISFTIHLRDFGGCLQNRINTGLNSLCYFLNVTGYCPIRNRLLPYNGVNVTGYCPIRNRLLPYAFFICLVLCFGNKEISIPAKDLPSFTKT